MKKTFLFAAVAALMAACSSNDDLTQPGQQQVPVLDDGAVGFDTYVERGLTRAGATGDIAADATLQATATDGFGVFAYYTDNNEYDAQTLPNFMYNQQVEYGSGYWTYTPIKYWPNEYGASAIADDNDKISFFAYAPYVDFNPATGKLKTIADGNDQWGIVQASRNTAAGDPWLKYLVSFDGDKQVDLLWGVNQISAWETVGGGTQAFTNGLPWLNVERPLGHQTQSTTADPNQRVKFQFKHALAKLTATIDAVVDAESGITNLLDNNTRIYVRSITFTGFTTKGMLNLNNTEAGKPLWLEYNGNGDLEPGHEVTIYDGRKDGKEGTSGLATNEKVLGLNPQLVQDEKQLTGSPVAWNNVDEQKHVGVINAEQNLFRKWSGTAFVENDQPLYVIPTGEEVQVTIVYDVETINPNLAVYLADGKTAGSSIENRITKTVNFGEAGLEAGKAYTLKLHLGMNSVKIDAAVTDWDADTPAQNIDLPANTPKFQAGNGMTYSWTVPYTATTHNVTLTGFNGGEAITLEKNGTVTGNTGNVANATGVVNASFTMAANSSTLNKTGSAKWSATSGKQVQLNITQLAQPLGLGAGTATGSVITLAKTADVTDGWTNVSKITVIRNGVELTETSESTVPAGSFKFDGGTITLNSAENAAGNTFVITVKSGDAPAETVTKTY